MKPPTPNEIKRAIKIWEKKNWEFKAKEALGDPQTMPRDIIDKKDWELADDVASFANTIGGYIVIGVEDDRKGRGLQNFSISDKLKSRISSILRQKINPKPHYDIDVVRINRKSVTVISIEEGDGDLCTVKGTIYIRDINGKTPATGAEITRIVKKRLGKKVIPSPTQREISDSSYNLPSSNERKKVILKDFKRVSSTYGFAKCKEILKDELLLTSLKIKNRKWFFLVISYGESFGVNFYRVIKRFYGSPVDKPFLSRNIPKSTEVYPLLLIMGRINSLKSELEYSDYSVVPTKYGAYLGPGNRQPESPFIGSSIGHVFMLSGITSKDIMNIRIEAYVRWLIENQQNLCITCKPVPLKK